MARFRFGLADRLHKTLGEIEELPLDELMGWQAYLKIMSEQ